MKTSLFRSSLLLICTLLCWLVPLCLYAEIYVIDGISYECDYGGGSGAVVTRNNNYSGDLLIPDCIFPYDEWSSVPVTGIGDNAFYQCIGLTSVTIPNSITTIGEGAFSCTSLTSVVIPNSVTSIGANPFSGCSSLISMRVDPNNVIYDSRDNCNAIIETSTNTLRCGFKNTTIPGSITRIGNCSFYECTGLTSLAIPNNVTSIGDYAFYGCSGLTSVTIPNSVTSIGSYTFEGCTSLTSVEIPNSVTIIGNAAFLDCSGLSSIIVDEGNTNYDSRNNCNAIIESSTNILITGCKNTVVPNNVTSIGGSAFSGCTGLISVEIPNSVTSIGEWAFSGCKGLTSVEIPNSVTSISYSTFQGCWGLTTVTIPNSVKSIGSRAFLYCYSLNSVEIPNGVTGIGDSAFGSCISLTSVTIPNSVTSIGESAFYGCTGLTSITVERENPVSVNSYTFYNVDKSNCTLYVPTGSKTAYESASGWSEFQNIVEYTPAPEVLATGSCGDNVTYTLYSDMTMVISGTGAMWSYSYSSHISEDYYQSIKRVFIEEGVTSISYDAFYRWAGLTTLSISNSVTSIGKYAFSGCIGLTSVTIPNSVTSIGSNAFSGCTSLTTVSMPSSVTSIGYAVFQGCSSLTYVSIPNGVTSIGEYAFQDCTGLTSVEIPNSLTSISNSAFSNCTGLTSVDFPSSVMNIDNGAFSGCIGLTSVIVPSSVTGIGAAFSGCTNLNSIVVSADNSTYDSRDNCNAIIETSTNTLIGGCKNTIIPNSVTSIGGSAFNGFTSLTTLTIPNSVTSIGGSAFEDCTGLTSITVEGGTPPSVGSYAFYNVNKSNCTLYVPAGSKSAYENTEVWHDFKNIVEYTPAPEVLATGSCGDNVTYTIYSDMTMVISGTGEMWDYSYDTHINDDYYQSIKSVIIEEGVTSIGEAAFVNCTSLTSITIPSSVSYIAATTYGELPIDFEVKTLGAFYGCSVLSSINVDAGNPTYDSRNNCNAIVTTATNKLIVGCVNSVIENSITSIGESAFEKCYGLTTMNIPNSVTSLGKCAFRGCRDLNSVTIPNSISLINIFTFDNCPSLTTIYVEQKTPPTLVVGGEFSDLVFDKDFVDSGTLYVPAGSKSAYENAVGWCKFEHIVEYGEEPDTDISTLDNAIYVDHIEGRIGGTMDIPIKVKSSSPIDDFKFKMILPAGTTVNSWALSSNRLPSGATVDDHFSEQNIEGNTITLACMLNYNAATFTGNDGEIATVNVTFGENMEVGTYPIRLTGCNIGHIDLSDVKATLNLEDYVVGDANGDGRVRIGDASAILHYIVGYPSADFHEKAADVNGDGLIRIGDVSAVLKIIVGL